MQELFLRLVDDGVLDEDATDGSGNIWHDLRGAGEHTPRFALEAVVHWLDRRITAAGNSLDDDELDLRDRDQSGLQLIAKVARAEPRAFVDEILPRVVLIVRLAEGPGCDPNTDRPVIAGESVRFFQVRRRSRPR